MKPAKGFTLTEPMFAVAITAILASVALSRLQRLRSAWQVRRSRQLAGCHVREDGAVLSGQSHLCGHRLCDSRLERGFSLVELCIGLAVLGILISLVIPDMRAWLQNTQLRTTAESIQNGLQLARSEAVRRNLFVTFTLNGVNWTVQGAGDASATQASSVAGTGNSQVAASQNAVVFTGVGWVNPLPAADITFNITNSTGGTCAASGGPMRCLRVTVSAGGQIRMCDPAAATGTAAACS